MTTGNANIYIPVNAPYIDQGVSPSDTYHPGIHVLDTSDPDTLAAVLRILNDGGGFDTRTLSNATNAREFILGTESAPSQTYFGNNKTGTYSPGTDKVAVTVGGSEIIRYDKVGMKVEIKGSLFVDNNLAIGMAGGSDLLHIRRDIAGGTRFLVENYDATGQVALRCQTSTYYAQNLLYNSGSYYNNTDAPNVHIGSMNASGSVQIQAGGSTRVFINANGYQGLGTTNPVSLTHLKSVGQTELTIEGDGGGYHNGALVLKANSSAANYRALGTYAHDFSGGNEIFWGRPYASSDCFTVCRSITAIHNAATASIANALFTVKNTGVVNVKYMPTSPVGLAQGDLYLDANNNVKAIP
ncbi:MAG: hypothetical protein JKX72_04860 [Robiginitomaculum sp.]|nr:hypothetical protein [Robiginitomaculum sp.]